MTWSPKRANTERASGRLLVLTKSAVTIQEGKGRRAVSIKMRGFPLSHLQLKPASLVSLPAARE